MLYFTPSKLSENIHVTPEGYLVCLGVPIGRTGEMEYGPGETPLEVGPDGKVRIVRDAMELFKPEAIASFEGKSVTIQHPEDFVDPTNWRELTHGTLRNVRRGTGENATDLIADVLITDAKAIELVKAGIREVSCGYEAEYVQTGIGRGIQKNIVGNHLALVDQGRAGASYAIKDHKGETMNLADKVKALFGKAQNDALALIEEGKKDGGAAPVTKTGDAAAPGMSDEMGTKILEGLNNIAKLLAPKTKTGDASTEPTESQPAKVEAMDAEAMKKMFDAINARLDKLENAATGDAEGEEGENTAADAEEEEMEASDAESEGEEDESEDDDFEESEMTGDAAFSEDDRSRAEIIAPGFKVAKGEKNPKGAALRAAYATKDGKRVIDSITGGSKAPAFDKPVVANVLFKAAAELLKRDRRSSLGKTKTRDFNSVLDDHAEGSNVMTAEKLNEQNAKHYGQAKH